MLSHIMLQSNKWQNSHLAAFVLQNINSTKAFMASTKLLPNSSLETLTPEHQNRYYQISLPCARLFQAVMQERAMNGNGKGNEWKSQRLDMFSRHQVLLKCLSMQLPAPACASKCMQCFCAQAVRQDAEDSNCAMHQTCHSMLRTQDLEHLVILPSEWPRLNVSVEHAQA